MKIPKSLIPLGSTVKRKLDQLCDILHKSIGNASFAGDGLAVYGKSLAFSEKDNFKDLVNHHAENHEDAARIWRLHTLCWAAKHGISLEGDFVECGVYRGLFSHVVCDFLKFEDRKDKKFYLYDTFEGFSPKYTSPEDFSKGQLFIDVAQNDYAKGNNFDYVQKRFSKFTNVEIVKGVLPDVLQKKCPGKIAFLHMDLNSPTAEKLTLERLFPLLTAGGILIFDDYGWNNFRKQEVAANEFLAKSGEMVLELPTGQGIVIKK